MVFTFRVWRFEIELTVADIDWEDRTLDIGLLVSWGESDA